MRENWSPVGVGKFIAERIISFQNGNENPEHLTGNLSVFWSRQINDKDHLIYKIDDKNIYILACGYHYGDTWNTSTDGKFSLVLFVK